MKKLRTSRYTAVGQSDDTGIPLWFLITFIAVTGAVIYDKKRGKY